MKKTNVQNRPDRRSQRTRQLLSNALIALMLEKPYHDITVQEIVERANVGRSTFYAHYQSKDDLLPSEGGRLIEELSHTLGLEQMKPNQLLPSLELFHHAQQFYPLYRAVIWQQGLDVVYKSVQDVLSQSVQNRLDSLINQQKSSVSFTLLSNYVASTFLTLLKWWLDNHMSYSPERMDELFQQLVMPGVTIALGMKL